METSCKTCIHKKVCDLWRKQECQNAKSFFDDECELYDAEQSREKVTVETLNDIISSLKQPNMSPDAANTILLGQIALNLAAIADSLERKGRR